MLDPCVSQATKRRLEFVGQLRDFARDRIGLNAAASFTNYEDNSGGPAAYAVSAAHKDRLESFHFTFPFVGQYDAKGFFDRGLAERERDALNAQNLDTFLGQVEGFSTMGLLPDPIRASNLSLDDYDLAEFVLHELTHNTIFKANDTDFNESMATFIGRQAAQRFFDEVYGADSSQAAAARMRYADAAVIDAYVVALYSRVEAFYEQPLSSEEKVAGRQAVFDEMQQFFRDTVMTTLSEPARYERIGTITLNNAVILAGTRYQAGLDVYQAVFDKVNGDFAALLDVLREAARQEDGRAFLQEWAATMP